MENSTGGHLSELSRASTGIMVLQLRINVTSDFYDAKRKQEIDES